MNNSGNAKNNVENNELISEARKRLLEMNLRKNVGKQHTDKQDSLNDGQPTEKKSKASTKTLEDRYGIKKVEKPLRDSQASFRIPKEIHDRFREIVKELYYPHKPNYNETLVQILTEFVKTFEKENENENNE